MRIIKLVAFVAIVPIILYACSTKEKKGVIDSYPNPRPDSAALRFLPGIVTSDSLDFNGVFSNDGKTFYFSRKKHGNSGIYSISFDGKGWSSPQYTAFADTAYLEADPFVDKDGSVFYISNRPRKDDRNLKDHDIWVVHQLKNGGFSAPENVEGINTDSTEYYVSIATNGNIYFSSNRNGGVGQLDIYMSKVENGKYTKPVNLGTAINGVTDEHDPYISADEQFLVFTSDRPGGYGEGDLYISQKDKDGNWKVAKNMGSKFNTATYEYCPGLSPDKKYFFFTSERDVKWINARFLSELLK